MQQHYIDGYLRHVADDRRLASSTVAASGDITDFETCGACLEENQSSSCEAIYYACACDCGRITGYSEC